MHLEREKIDVVLYFKTKKSLYLLGDSMKQNLKHFPFVATVLPVLMNKTCETPTGFLMSAVCLARLSYRVRGRGLLYSYGWWQGKKKPGSWLVHEVSTFSGLLLQQLGNLTGVSLGHVTKLLNPSIVF